MGYNGSFVLMRLDDMREVELSVDWLGDFTREIPCPPGWLLREFRQFDTIKVFHQAPRALGAFESRNYLVASCLDSVAMVLMLSGTTTWPRQSAYCVGPGHSEYIRAERQLDGVTLRESKDVSRALSLWAAESNLDFNYDLAEELVDSPAGDIGQIFDLLSILGLSVDEGGIVSHESSWREEQEANVLRIVQGMLRRDRQ
ncbi:hypothetical protein [Variovorax sp. PBS-H4]|uniref:hypothetical protein n=1 Tax=Variovorax sp. PBS-H4 TaxID=434008 RepID=UPI0013A5470B|nr:hypothetical protein [Variovorax sp. PBS-H4]